VTKLFPQAINRYALREHRTQRGFRTDIIHSLGYEYWLRVAVGSSRTKLNETLVNI
jgi:hypothetical protein